MSDIVPSLGEGRTGIGIIYAKGVPGGDHGFEEIQKRPLKS
jgi:hypothetical protein